MANTRNENPVFVPTGSRRLVAPELLRGLEVFPPPDLAALAATRNADFSAFAPAMPPALAAIRREQCFTPGIGGAPDVRLLVYFPPDTAATPRPGYLYIHGGGYVLGSPEMTDGICRSAAFDLGCVVVSVAYRLAPETCFPGALEDCYSGLGWLHRHAAELGVDPARIAVGGGSAGGGHAAALAIFARDKGEYPICFQSLDCPMLDDRTGSAGEPHPYCGEFVWTPAHNRFGWGRCWEWSRGGPMCRQRRYRRGLRIYPACRRPLFWSGRWICFWRNPSNMPAA